MANKDKWGAEIGQRITCQLCGKQIFLLQTGYNTVDAAIKDRHSFYDVFEPVPEGWNIKHDAGGWLCPECNERYKLAIKALKENY
jgi:hypothetical protein